MVFLTGFGFLLKVQEVDAEPRGTSGGAVGTGDAAGGIVNSNISFNSYMTSSSFARFRDRESSRWSSFSSVLSSFIAFEADLCRAPSEAH